jgi:hypothetical protein
MPANPASILDSVKKALGVMADDTSFDLDITMYINAVFGILSQLGLGPTGGFLIMDNSTLWADFTDRVDILGLLQTYMTSKVKLMFDPPQNGFAINAIESINKELESRINMMAEATPDKVSLGKWWDLTGMPDFPLIARIGDFGFDTLTWDIFVNERVTSPGAFWDLTGLSDFPAEAATGDIGYDKDTGDVWKKV